MDESLGPPPPPGDEGPAGGPAAKPRDLPGPVALPEAADHPLSQGPGPVVVGAYSLDPADPGETRSVLGGVRDNLEAIAFALVLALLLRHFCIEVFKIPTGSMEPTLFGDNSATHPTTAGDRIIVDKLAYVFRGPLRWEVAVFHYPLDWSRNLPGSV